MKRILLGLIFFALCGCRDGQTHRIEWPVMGTVAGVQFRGGTMDERKRLAEEVRKVFAEVERLLNAHDPNSELSSFKGLGDREILLRCDKSVRGCYEAAFEMREKTGGRFDPRWRKDGTLDLGAIAKGYAVDLACERTKDAKLEMLVDLGGNLKALSGEWRTAVCGSSETLVLTGGMACATSAEYFRGRHIKNALDGGEPVASGKSVTIVHPSSAMMADALSTVMFIMGRNEGGRFLDLHCPQASAMWLETSCPEANGLSERKRPVCH